MTDLTRYAIYQSNTRWMIRADRGETSVIVAWRRTERAARAFVADLEQRTALVYDTMRETWTARRRAERSGGSSCSPDEGARTRKDPMQHGETCRRIP